MPALWDDDVDAAVALLEVTADHLWRVRVRDVGEEYRASDRASDLAERAVVAGEVQADDVRALVRHDAGGGLADAAGGAGQKHDLALEGQRRRRLALALDLVGHVEGLAGDEGGAGREQEAKRRVEARLGALLDEDAIAGRTERADLFAQAAREAFEPGRGRGLGVRRGVARGAADHDRATAFVQAPHEGLEERVHRVEVFRPAHVGRVVDERVDAEIFRGLLDIRGHHMHRATPRLTGAAEGLGVILVAEDDGLGAHLGESVREDFVQIRVAADEDALALERALFVGALGAGEALRHGEGEPQRLDQLAGLRVVQEGVAHGVLSDFQRVVKVPTRLAGPPGAVPT